MDKDSFVFAKDSIQMDMQRAIYAVERGESAPNFLCALGLLCYTEFAGGIDLRCANPRKRFDHFFRKLGQPYAQLLDQGHNIYDILRCGLAHEYFTKRHCKIAIVTNSGEPDVGVSFDPADGTYAFRVKPYYRDFMVAFDALQQRLGLA